MKGDGAAFGSLQRGNQAPSWHADRAVSSLVRIGGTSCTVNEPPVCVSGRAAFLQSRGAITPATAQQPTKKVCGVASTREADLVIPSCIACTLTITELPRERR